MNPTTKGYKQVNGIKMYDEIYGSGEPLVLIHGGGGSILYDYREIIGRLQINFSLSDMFEKDSRRMQTFEDGNPAILENIKTPALFISGDKDVVKPEHSVEMMRLVKNSQLVILPATHGFYMISDFERNTDENLIEFTVTTVEKFLKK